MKRIILILSLTFLSIIGGRSQNGNRSQVGITGGYSATWYNLSKNSDIWGNSFGPGSSFHAGVSFKIPINNNFVIQPQALLAARSLREVGKNNYAPYDYKSSVAYIDFPVQLQFRWPMSFKSCCFFFVEPFAGVGISDKITGYYRAGDVEFVYGYPSFKASGLASFEYGLGAGIGYEWKRLQVEIKYDWCLNKYGSDTEAKAGIEEPLWNSRCSGLLFSLTFWI